VDWNTHHPLSRKKTATMMQAFGFGRRFQACWVNRAGVSVRVAAWRHLTSEVAGEPLGFPPTPTEEIMDWNRVQGSWKQLEGKVKAKWGKLTDDDLTTINGRREELEGKIQQRYGIAKDQARKEIDDWFTSQGY
jgi:uncharacterized protein YjbJ (UPF0337 family)